MNTYPQQGKLAEFQPKTALVSKPDFQCSCLAFERIKESDGESVVIGIPADIDNIPTIRSGSFNLMPAYVYVRFILKHSKKHRPYSTILNILTAGF
jgi:hypothetical protein